MLKRSSARKTLTICIDEVGDVSVSVPFRSPDKEIISFLNEKENWIITKVQEAKRRQAKIDKKRFIDGHEFLFLGKKFPIKISQGNIKRSRVDFNGQSWELIISKNITG